MFYLSKFCRICVKSGVKLTNIHTKDYDCVKLSEKLAVCTKMVINKDSLSSDICMSCVQKLRVSYEFQEMCKRSSMILQGYLSELTSASDKVKAEEFVNSELRVTVTPVIRLQHQRKKRVSKEQRCSLLKKLLLKIKEESAEDVVREHKRTVVTCKSAKEVNKKGGLRNLINFTRNFDFGYAIDPNKSYEISPLDRLMAFSKTFFYSDFTAFQKTVVTLLNMGEEDSEEDELLTSLENKVEFGKFEEVMLQPDVKIKQEYEFECEDEENFESTYDFSSNFVEVCYDNKYSLENSIDIKEEPLIDDTNNLVESSYVNENKYLAEIIPVTQPSLETVNSIKTNNENKYKSLRSALSSPITQDVPATELLGKFVAQFSHSKRTLSPHSTRCRTRGAPYINPQLQKQFQLRSFTCKTCNRRFKSPGYLNAHVVKLRH